MLRSLIPIALIILAPMLASTTTISAQEETPTAIEVQPAETPTLRVEDGGIGPARESRTASFGSVSVNAYKAFRENGEIRGNVYFHSGPYDGINIYFYACRNKIGPDQCFDGSAVNGANWPGTGSWSAATVDQNSCVRIRDKKADRMKYYTRVLLVRSGTIRAVAESQDPDFEAWLDCG